MPDQAVFEFINSRANYGPILSNFKFTLRGGYSTLVGKNDSGKSALLQFVFKSLCEANDQWKNKMCLVTQDRQYIQPSTPPPTNLHDYNNQLYSQMTNSPKPSSGPVGPDSSMLYTLLLHRTDFINQLGLINKYLIRLGFGELVLKGVQIANIDNVEISSHGSGLRCVMPVLAALTSPDISVILIDEPELSLEARAQKALKEILLESANEGKTILLATQSHIFLDKEGMAKNFVVSNSGGHLEIDCIRSGEQLIDVTYNLLGNSLEDLYFPGNFLIVEGGSDQVICEKVASLLNLGSGKIKIISAKGIDNVSDTYRAIKNTLIPLLTSDSPYSKRVVLLIDKPIERIGERVVEELSKALGGRCVVLDVSSIEEYIPENIYKKSGRNKSDDLQQIEEIKKRVNHGDREAFGRLRGLKKEISSALASVLTEEELDGIPIVRDAVKLAKEKSL